MRANPGVGGGVYTLLIFKAGIRPTSGWLYFDVPRQAQPKPGEFRGRKEVLHAKSRF